MLGINGVLACGLHRTYGWQLAALAGVTAMMPDWDGLPILVSLQLFERSHRVWGHSLLTCLVLGVSVGGFDYRCDVATRVARGLTRRCRIEVPASQLVVRRQFPARGLMVWIATAMLAALSHLPADLVVSGTSTLADWHLQLFWPWSETGYVWPLVAWGDPALSIIFVAGMFALVRWRARTERIARCTLLGICGYLVLRAMVS